MVRHGPPVCDTLQVHLGLVLPQLHFRHRIHLTGEFMTIAIYGFLRPSSHPSRPRPQVH